MSAAFTHASGSVTFSRNPARPGRSLGFTQPVEESTGSEKYGYQLYVKHDLLELPIRMTTTEKLQFITFFRSVARGMANAFTYTDPLGVDVSVRFAASRLPEIVERAYDTHICTIPLRIA